ncbi:acetylcholinesterase-like [Antedon mediterranea]|uniref:acetylcholinesterase-like n=1 Tax=Antedon mediterranea TaxID=105859 RepID=UPI003AF514B0
MLCLPITFLAVLGTVFGYPQHRLFETSVEISGTVYLGKTYEFMDDQFLNINSSVDAFEGIPYAEPPVRFMPPEPKRKPTTKPWFYNASFNRPACSQEPSTFVSSDLETSEDCLYLNIYTPKLCERDTKLAVMVWLHGGSFTYGMGANEFYSPVPIVAIGNVIVVTLNYRLGLLGFLSTGDDVVPGNMGLLDQIMALQWIQDNIKAFGGDPSRVTLFGDSAGAISAGIHLFSPKSSGLFSNVIMTSGTYLTPRFIVDEATVSNRGRALGKTFGCNFEDSQEFINCLSRIDVDILLANATIRTFSETGESLVLTAFTPVVDGSVILARAMEMVRGEMNEANVIIGSSANEGSIFISLLLSDAIEEPEIDKATYDLIAGVNFLEYVSDPFLKDAIDMQYLNTKHFYNANKNRYDELSNALGDWWFVCPSDKTVRELLEKTKNVYYYQMTQIPTVSVWGKTWLKATHSEIVSFMFGFQFNTDISHIAGRLSEDDVLMSKKTIRYFTNFAKTGNPNEENQNGDPATDPLPIWNKYSVPKLEYKKLSVDMDNAKALKEKECRFWNHFYPQAVDLTGKFFFSKSDPSISNPRGSGAKLFSEREAVAILRRHTAQLFIINCCWLRLSDRNSQTILRRREVK